MNNIVHIENTPIDELWERLVDWHESVHNAFNGTKFSRLYPAYPVASYRLNNKHRCYSEFEKDVLCITGRTKKDLENSHRERHNGEIEV